MSANRHLGRIIALQTLYEKEFRESCDDESFSLKEVLGRNISRYDTLIDDVAFVEGIVEGICKYCDELDAKIQPIAPDWPLDQIARMDRLVLRIGAYELLHEQKTPPKVVINEAVELAKSFGGENSSKFINGVLGTLYRQEFGEPKADEPKKSKGEDKKSKPNTKPKKEQAS